MQLRPLHSGAYDVLPATRARHLAAWALLPLLSIAGCADGARQSDSVAVRAEPVLGDALEPIALSMPYTRMDTLALDQERYYRITVPEGHEGLRLSIACPAGCSLNLRRKIRRAVRWPPAASAPARLACSSRLRTPWRTTGGTCR